MRLDPKAHRCLLFGLAIGVIVPFLASTAAAADRAVPDMLPDGTLLYIGWPGIDKLSDVSKDTAMADLMKEPEIVRFRQQFNKEVWPAIEDLIAREGGPEGRMVLDIGQTLLSQLWRHPFAIALIGVSMGEAGPQADATIIVRADDESGELVDLLESLLEEARMPAEPEETEIDGAKFKQVPMMGPNMPLRWGVLGDDFIVSIGAKLGDHLNGDLAEKSLGHGERFSQAMKIMGVQPDMPTFYLDLKGVVDTLTTFQPMFAGFEVPILGEEGGVQKVLDELGLSSIRSLSMVMEPKARGFQTTMLVHAPGLGEPDSLLKQKPLMDADLAVVPADASWMSVGNVDLLAAYKAGLDAVEGLAPEVHEEVMGVLAEVQDRIGLKIEDDLIGAFGDTWALFDAPSHGGLWFLGSVLVVDLKPDADFDRVASRIVELIAEEMGPEGGIEIASETHREQRIRYVNVTGLPMPMAPAWAQYEGKLIAALYPQMVRVTLDRLIDKGDSILTNADFVRGRKLMPENAHSMSYVDTKEGVQQMYPMLLPIAQVLMAMGQGEGIAAKITMLPTTETMTKHLFGKISASATTEDGMISVSHGALPTAIPAIGNGGMMLPMMLGFAMPAMVSARTQAKRTVSMANLHQIGTACFTYAMENDDNYPPNLQTLVDEGSLTPRVLKSPLDKSDREVSYVYISGVTGNVDRPSETVVAYEHPDIHNNKATNVLFADGHVEYLDMERFNRVLEETNKRLGRDLGQPAELR